MNNNKNKNKLTLLQIQENTQDNTNINNILDLPPESPPLIRQINLDSWLHLKSILDTENNNIKSVCIEHNDSSRHILEKNNNKYIGRYINNNTTYIVTLNF